MFKWLIGFLKEHSEIRLTMEYNLYMNSIVFTIDRYPCRKRLEMLLGVIESSDENIMKIMLEKGYEELVEFKPDKHEDEVIEDD